MYCPGFGLVAALLFWLGIVRAKGSAISETKWKHGVLALLFGFFSCGVTLFSPRLVPGETLVENYISLFLLLVLPLILGRFFPAIGYRRNPQEPQALPSDAR